MAYDDDNQPQGLGTQPSGPGIVAPKTYNAAPEVAAAETRDDTGAEQAEDEPQKESAALDSLAAQGGGYVKGGLEKLVSKTPVGKFLVGGKVKAYIAGILIFFVGIIALAFFTFNLPSASVQAAGNGLTDTYFGAAIVTNTLHLDVYASRVLSKVRTVGLTEMCSVDGCVVESKLKGTKLGKFSFTMKQRVVAANEKVGTSILTDGSRNYTGLRVDTNNEKSPFYKEGGSSGDQLKATLIEAGATDFSIEEVQKGVYNVVDDGISKFGKSDLFTSVVKESGFLPDVLSKSSGVRSLGRSLGLGFHPLQALRKVSDWEKNKSQIIADWLDNRNRALTSGEISDKITISSTQQDKNGNTTTVDEKTVTKEGYRSTLDKLQGIPKEGVGKAATSISGGVLMLQGAVCMVKAFYTAKEGVITTNNIPTAMRSAQNYMSAAEQTQAVSSADLDSEAVDAYVSNVLEKKNSDGSIDSFSQSREFGNLNGTGAGQAPSSDISLMLGDTSDISPAMKPIYDLAMGDLGTTLCTGVGGALTAGVGIILAVVSDGIITTAGAAIVGAAVGFGVENMGNLMAKSLDPANYGPAQNYNMAGKGAGYLAAASSWSNGGSFQSSSSQAELRQIYVKSQQEAFSSKSIAYRLFNAYDSKSLAGQVAVNNSSSLSANLLKMGRQLTGGTLIASSFTRIASGSAYATDPYDPCTQTKSGCVNLSSAVVNDDGTRAAGVLNGANGQKYVDLLKECHNIVFTKDASGDWTTSVSGVESYMKAAVSKTTPSNCVGIETDPSVVALLSYTNLESAMALSVCMTAPKNSTDRTDEAACTRVGYGTAPPAAAPAAISPAVPTKDGWVWPVPGHTTVSRGYGVYGCGASGCGPHKGIDIPAPVGTPVVAAHSGTIVATSGGCNGSYLIKATGTNVYFAYQHLNQPVSKKVGDTVNPGDVLGTLANIAGKCGTGPHLHFSIEKTNHISIYIDPPSLSNTPNDYLPTQ